MSMHAMEDLVECSILTIAAADPAPANARDLCHSLYALQDFFDGGYTVLRVLEELERLGYLRRLAPERLPQPEREAVSELSGTSGFIGESPGSYFDAKSGLCCVTAGSPLWEKLCQSGVLACSDAAPVQMLPSLDLAEQIAELAAMQADENALQTLGLWYGLFPAVMLLDSDGEELTPRQKALRDRLAVAEAFPLAEQWGLLPSADEAGEYDLFEEQWLAPYNAMRRNPQVLMQYALKALQQKDYASASALADGLPEGIERVYFQSMASLCHYQALAAGEALPPFQGLMDLEAVRDGFASILEKQPQIDYLCNVNLAAAQSLLGKHWDAFEALKNAFVPAFEKLQENEDDWSRRYSEAVLSVTFYLTISSSTPDGAPEKKQMLSARAGRLLTIQEARDTLATLLGERSEQAWSCHYQLGLCWNLEGNCELARRELEEAERLHPGDPDVQAALDTVSGKS